MTDLMRGVRILEVAQWWFVPAAGALLADWGADVIKIEHPDTGDGQRGLMTSGLVANTGGVNFMMEQSNRGKRSVGIDIAHPDGRELIYRLAETSDVFLTNFLPPARKKLQIDVEHIRARNPEIIYVRGSGQGVRGPHAERAGYDAVSFWARGGIGDALTRPDDEVPVGPRAAFGDSIGAMTIAGGISAALFRRAQHGETSIVDVSLLSSAMWTLGPDLVVSKLMGVDKMFIGGGRGASPNPVVNSYQTKDERWIMLNLLQADRWWPDFCRHIDRPELISDPRFVDMKARFENREECVSILDEVFRGHTYEEWKLKLDTMEGAWAPWQTPKETTEDPQVEANGYMPTVTAADGKNFQLVSNPVQFDETAPALRPAPEHGQHTEEVLLDLGLEWDEIARHKEAGAIL